MRKEARHAACWLATAWLAAFTGASGAADPGRTFIACPVYRDTDSGRKSGCWLATDESSGVRYDVSQSRTKPQLGHEVLVEGVLGPQSVSAAASLQDTPCGALPLAPVVVSVLESRCPSFMLPAEGYPGRRFVLDPKLVLPPADVPEALPPPPYPPRSWSIEFTYQSDFLQYQYSEVILDEIGRYVRASHPRRVDVVGYAVSAPRVVSEHALAETAALARARAEMVAEALRRLGASAAMLHVSYRENPPPLADPAALAQPSRRRVEIHVSY